MRIENTAFERKPTRHFYDEEVMGDEYDPPGIAFSRESGVARVKQDVGEALCQKYSHFEPVEDSDTESSDTDADTDSSEDESADAVSDDDTTE